VADNRKLLQVSSEQREELERWAQSRSLPAGDVFRARLILALADGQSYREIERRWGASAPTVSKWKSRFEESGVAGLQARHRGSKPRTVTPAVQIADSGARRMGFRGERERRSGVKTNAIPG
jgi:hypothetical protein